MTTTAKHLLSEIVAGLDGVSIPDDIAKVAQTITEQFATWLLLHEREELAAEIGKALIAARRQAFEEAATLIQVRQSIYASKECDADPFKEAHLNHWDMYRHTREAFDIAVEEIKEAAGIIARAEETKE